MTSFAAGEQPWIERLGTLRNVVRQEVIARQIAPLAGRGTTVLDVGGGQGTQALRLASSGCRVTVVDPSSDLLALCAEAVDEPPPDPETLELLLRAEEQAGSMEPYKWMASQLHVIAAAAV